MYLVVPFLLSWILRYISFGEKETPSLLSYTLRYISFAEVGSICRIDCSGREGKKKESRVVAHRNRQTKFLLLLLIRACAGIILPHFQVAVVFGADIVPHLSHAYTLTMPHVCSLTSTPLSRSLSSCSIHLSCLVQCAINGSLFLCTGAFVSPNSFCKCVS